MAAGRFAVYVIGLLLVLAALYLLLTETGIASIVPTSLIAIAVLLILGLALMGGARTIPRRHTTQIVERPGTTVVERPVGPGERVVEDRPYRRRWWR